MDINKTMLIVNNNKSKVWILSGPIKIIHT